MKIFANIFHAITEDKTVLIVGFITLVLLGLLLNSHRWQAIPESAMAQPTLSQTLPDFGSIESVKEKKQSFFDFLRPYIRQENQRIQYDRAFLESIENELQDNAEYHRAGHRKLRKLASRYRLEMKDVDETIEALKLRVDIIPEALVLVQAANESAWGTSRFAQKANNLFGQWCYTKGCGLVPKGRIANAKHEVRSFDTPQASVVSYMRNLNTHNAYNSFRKIRSQLRASGQKVTGVKLAAGLENYSERRGEYVSELQSMIRHNALE